MIMKYAIYFSDSGQPHNHNTRAVFAQTEYGAIAAFDALCKWYLHVTVFEALNNGDVKIIRNYKNI